MYTILVVIAVVYGVFYIVHRIRTSEPTDYWDKYKEQLEADKKWWACADSEEGCDWPGICTPGDCRKVEDFRRKDL